MPILTWNDTLKVGIASIDAQHKRLVDLLNDLADAMSTGKGAEVVQTILKGLIDYTVTHFANEESLLKKFNYPDFVKHREEHQNLIAKINDFRDRYAKGQTMISVELLNFLKNWLTTHIQGTDKQYVAFLLKSGVN